MSWLESIDLDALVARYGNAAVDRALTSTHRYIDPPRFAHWEDTSAQHVQTRAVFLEGQRLSAPVTIEVRALQHVHCTCSRCEHPLALLVDLAVSPALREALIVGDDTEPLLEALAELRAQAAERMHLEERLARWLPEPRHETLEIDVEPVAATPTPLLLVRCRRHGDRAPLPVKPLLAAPVGPRERRWIDLTLPHHADRHALVATRGQAALVLAALAQDLSVSCNNFRDPVTFAKEPVRPCVEVAGDRLVVRWITRLDSGASRSLGDASALVLFAGPRSFVWSAASRTFHPVAEDVDLHVARGMQEIPSLPNDVAVGRALLLRGRGRGIELPPPQALGLPPLERPRFELRLQGTPLAVEARAFAQYAAGSADLLATVQDTWRHTEAEEEALRHLASAGLTRDGAVLRAHEDAAVQLWRTGLDELRAQGFAVHLAETLGRPRVISDVELDVHVRGRVGWLDADLTFRAEALEIELRRLHDVLAEGHRWIELDDGALARIQDDVAELLGEMRTFPHPAARVERWMHNTSSHVHVRHTAVRPSPPRLPPELRATLRPYQLESLAWLQWLHTAQFSGGILADDMGLGKTLTTLAFLAEAYASSPNEGAPSLVVCPTSLVGNWLAEAARFVPQLRVAAWDPLSADPTAQVLVTSYGRLRRHPELTYARWFCAVLDEAQVIKNPRTEVSRAARSLDAELRLALSGTPVENHLRELWSLFDFVQPGLLGSEQQFENAYEIGRLGAERVRTMIRPFVLRRRKEQVLHELPPKIEVERVCVLDDTQKRAYDALAIALRQTLRVDEQKRKLARARLSALTAILRLRQMACDPRLVDGAAAPSMSAKRTEFLDLVRELVSSGRRALVFSQFVGLFDLWRRDLDDAHIAYEYLDGQTRDRDEVVRRFQQGEAPLFLISLKAGGFGLNLTAADTVIHCDPWWNPAVEDQAESRAHRMGQARSVTVIRLVAQGTIEHKLALLKEHKRDLVRALWDNDSTMGQQLSDAELDALLAPIDADASE